MMRLLRLLALLLFVIALPTGGVAPVLAQNGSHPSETTENAPPDYAAWEQTAKRAEDAVAAGRASDAALGQLRADIVDWRTRFLAAQKVNSTQIETLKNQIDALGPVPAEGQSEPQEIASRRAELNRQLDELRAPVLKAEEAYRHADGIIQQIDATIRERQTNELLQLGPSPLNPVHWVIGLKALGESLAGIADESAAAWTRPLERAGLKNNLPVVILYAAIAVLLLLRGRIWMEWVQHRLFDNISPRGATLLGAALSVGQIVLPLVGLMFLKLAIDATELVGLRGTRFVDLVPELGFIVIAAIWLGGRIFPPQGTHPPFFRLDPEANTRARWISAGLGVLVALSNLVRRLVEYEEMPREAWAILSFPMIVLAGVLMFGLARTLMQHVHAGNTSVSETPYRDRLVQLTAQGAMIVAVVGPAIAAAGYTALAHFVTYPAIQTLALLAAMMVAQRVVTGVYGMITGNQEGAGDALIPVLIGFALFLLALPVLALIWGARVTDLTELWTRFTEGFSLGGTRISPVDFLTFAVVFAVGYTATRLLQGALRSSVLPKTKIDTGGRNAIVSGVGYLGIFLAVVVSITTAGIDLSSLAIVAGALSVGIGFGLQNIVSNFVSGIILLIERPISEGDWVEVGGMMGTVRSISVRSTVIETFDRTEVIVPNADFVSGMVTNWTKSNLTGRLIVKVGVAYGTDTQRVQTILEEIAMAHPLVIISPPPLVTFLNFGADALEFEIRVILRDVNFILNVHSEINHEIARRFTEEGIEIPFAQRDIWLRNPEALRPAPRQEDDQTAAAPSGPQLLAQNRAPRQSPPEQTDDATKQEGDE